MLSIIHIAFYEIAFWFLSILPRTFAFSSFPVHLGPLFISFSLLIAHGCSLTRQLVEVKLNKAYVDGSSAVFLILKRGKCDTFVLTILVYGYSDSSDFSKP